MGYKKNIFAICVVFFLSWTLSYVCSLILHAYTFEIIKEKTASLKLEDYIVFIKNDDSIAVQKSQRDLKSISLIKNDKTVVNLALEKEGFFFPVKDGIWQKKFIGIVSVREINHYRLSPDSADNYKLYMAEKKKFTQALAIVITIGVSSSLILFIVFLYNLFKIPIILKIWDKLTGKYCINHRE